MFVAMAIVALFNLVMFLIKNQVINRIFTEKDLYLRVLQGCLMGYIII